MNSQSPLTSHCIEVYTSPLRGVGAVVAQASDLGSIPILLTTTFPSLYPAWNLTTTLFISQPGMKPSLQLSQSAWLLYRCFRSTPNGVLTPHM